MKKWLIILMLFGLVSCAGESGKDGANDYSAVDGINGVNGQNGIDGIDGTDGIDGKDGQNGIGGTSGVDGIDGSDGSNGTSGEDGHNGEDGIDGDVYANAISLNGKAENGPCRKPGTIIVSPLDSELYQSGTSFRGQIRKNTGEFKIRGRSAAQYAFYEAPNLTCFNEVSAGEDIGIQFFSLVDLTEVERNLNPLTTIQYFVTISYFDDTNHAAYQNIEASIVQSHEDILNYFDMTDDGTRFSEMTLQGSEIADAVLGLVDSMIANSRSSSEQNSYMIDIADGVIADDQTLKTSVLAQIEALPLMRIVNNLRNKYDSLGLGRISPPIWKLGAPDYYDDLLVRVPVSQGSLNSASTSGCSMDIPYKRYAIPNVFESWIETSNYIASNLGGDVSIWTRGTHADGYDAPGTKILDVEQLREKLLDSSLPHHGMIENHNLQSGDEVYFVAEKEIGWTLTKGCNADLLQFGRILASNDGGTTYIGWDNNSLFFRRGLSITGFD